MTLSRCIHVAANGITSIFLWLSNIPLYMCTIPSYPFLCRWTFSLLSSPGYYKQCCNDHWGACFFSVLIDGNLTKKLQPKNAEARNKFRSELRLLDQCNFLVFRKDFGISHCSADGVPKSTGGSLELKSVIGSFKIKMMLSTPPPTPEARSKWWSAHWGQTQVEYVSCAPPFACIGPAGHLSLDDQKCLLTQCIQNQTHFPSGSPLQFPN